MASCSRAYIPDAITRGLAKSISKERGIGWPRPGFLSWWNSRSSSLRWQQGIPGKSDPTNLTNRVLVDESESALKKICLAFPILHTTLRRHSGLILWNFYPQFYDSCLDRTQSCLCEGVWLNFFSSEKQSPVREAASHLTGTLMSSFSIS